MDLRLGGLTNLLTSSCSVGEAVAPMLVHWNSSSLQKQAKLFDQLYILIGSLDPGVSAWQ